MFYANILFFFVLPLLSNLKLKQMHEKKKNLLVLFLHFRSLHIIIYVVVDWETAAGTSDGVSPEPIEHLGVGPGPAARTRDPNQAKSESLKRQRRLISAPEWGEFETTCWENSWKSENNPQDVLILVSV